MTKNNSQIIKLLHYFITYELIICSLRGIYFWRYLRLIQLQDIQTNMRKINLHLTFSLNNIFITIVKNTISTVLWSQSLGGIGFKNKSKQLTEAFKLMLSRTTEYLISNSLKINQVYLSYLIKKRIKFLKKQIANWPINAIIINRGVSHNGCKTKKSSRKKHRSFKLQNIKL